MRKLTLATAAAPFAGDGAAPAKVIAVVPNGAAMNGSGPLTAAS